MELMHDLIVFSDKLLLAPFLMIFLANILITLKTGFIQLRMLPTMIRLFISINGKPANHENPNTLPSSDAVLTVISTTVGIGNLVGPIVAIQMGGPGAFIGFMLAVFFGAATIYTEVMFALIYRKKLPDGSWAGGPMQYLKHVFGTWASYIYGITGALLLIAWSSTQSNTLADICTTYSIPPLATGGFMALLVLIYLLAGIRKIGDLSAKIVPVMFAIITIVSLWIIGSHITELPSILWNALKEAFTPHALGGAGIGLTLRWAIAKGTQASEAAVGTSTMPHSQAETDNPQQQAIVAMLSAYAVLFISTMIGLVVLVTKSWQVPAMPLGIKVLQHSFAQYLPTHLSTIILMIAIFLFAFGSIIGNAYNGGQCFMYVTKNRWVRWYYGIVALILVFGALFPAEFIWSFLDFFVIPVALINVAGILILLFRRKK